MPEPSAELRAFVPLVELEDVGFVELAARRDTEATSPDEGPVDPTYTLTAQTSDDGRQFRLVLRIEIVTTQGEIRVAALGTYRLSDEAGPISQRVVVEFANEVGLMALLPYLRHAIADLSQRVFGASLLMPVMARGAISFPLPE